MAESTLRCAECGLCWALDLDEEAYWMSMGRYVCGVRCWRLHEGYRQRDSGEWVLDHNVIFDEL